MNIMWIGGGKLGYPCLLAQRSRLPADTTFTLVDTNKALLADYKDGKLPYMEPDAQILACSHHNITFRTKVEQRDVAKASFVFIAVPTPHAPEYDGSTPTSHLEARDFDYNYVLDALTSLGRALDPAQPCPVIVLISTVLPGTTRKHFAPLCNDLGIPLDHLIYSPSFIAQGTTVRDYLSPEFVLVGTHNGRRTKAAESYIRLVKDICHNPVGDSDYPRQLPPFQVMTWGSAELTKVSYNSWITAKIVLANTIGMMADVLEDGDATVVMNAIKKADRRIVSMAYMNAGGGDGGSCHPRDLIALRDHCHECRLPNFYADLEKRREDHAEWCADLIEQEMDKLFHQTLSDDDMWPAPIILGRAFKPGINIDQGSFGRLVASYLDPVLFYDIHMPEFQPEIPPETPRVFFLAVDDRGYLDLSYPEGSTIIDPWDLFAAQPPPGVLLVRPYRLPRRLQG